MIKTSRLTLVPATSALARAEIGDREAFSRELGAEVPENWPPETLADALPWFGAQLEASPGDAGWYGWYSLWSEGATRRPLLVGSVGFKGPPDHEGTVEIGYSVLPQFQRKGIASEMVAALLEWAFSKAQVIRVIAETTAENQPSVRLLERHGFARAGNGTEPGGVLFERCSPRRFTSAAT